MSGKEQVRLLDRWISTAAQARVQLAAHRRAAARRSGEATHQALWDTEAALDRGALFEARQHHANARALSTDHQPTTESTDVFKGRLTSVGRRIGELLHPAPASDPRPAPGAPRPEYTRHRLFSHAGGDGPRHAGDHPRP